MLLAILRKKRSQPKCPKIENTMWNDNALIDIRQLCFCGHFNAEKGYLVWYILFHWSKALVDDNPKLPTFPLKSSSIPPETFKLYPNSRDVESAAVSGLFRLHPQKRLTLHFLKLTYNDTYHAFKSREGIVSRPNLAGELKMG